MRDSVVFYLNNQRQVVRGKAAGLTLTDYLRNVTASDAESLISGAVLSANSSDATNGEISSSQLATEGCQAERLVGTKIACAEGDCGACTVLVGRPNETNKGFRYETIDACIAFVYQMDRSHVVTVEGLAKDDQLADVQQAMVDCHGSQCGFCTPGFVMAMQGLVEENAYACDDKNHKSKNLTDEQLRLGLSGNLCRCTGYSQILDAGYQTSGYAEDTESGYQLATRYAAEPMLEDFSNLAGAVHVTPNGEGTEIFIPASLDDLLARISERPEATIVSGATDLGVQYNHGRFAPSDIVTTRGIEELNLLAIDGNELVVGSSVPWSRLEKFLEDESPEFYDILIRFGSPQVRHAGTMGGNMANASPIADSLPWLYASDAKLELASTSGRRNVAIESFYRGYKQIDLKPGEVITAVRVALPRENESLKLYKLSKRRDMDISTVTAAFWLSFEGEQITSLRIALGGVGPTIIRATQAEAELEGKPFSLENMKSAAKIAREEITPLSDVRGSADYRLQVVENLFSKCFYDLTVDDIPTNRKAKG